VPCWASEQVDGDGPGNGDTILNSGSSDRRFLPDTHKGLLFLGLDANRCPKRANVGSAAIWCWCGEI